MFRYPLDPHLALGLLEARHAPRLLALIDRNRAYLREWLPWVDGTTTVDDSAAFIRNALEQFADNRGFQAGIWLDDDLVGMIGYHPIDWESAQVEIGYWLDAAHQGRGIMTRAVRALVDHAFGPLGLRRVQIRCAPGNHRSCAIPERLGFRREGVEPRAEWLYDHYEDLVVYGMPATAWPHPPAGSGAPTTDASAA